MRALRGSFVSGAYIRHGIFAVLNIAGFAGHRLERDRDMFMGEAPLPIDTAIAGRHAHPSGGALPESPLRVAARTKWCGGAVRSKIRCPFCVVSLVSEKAHQRRSNPRRV
jgi:hypothetical protein